MVIITGASSGIGEACAYRFAEEGKNLLLIARRLDRLQSLQKDIQSKYRVHAHIASLDIRDLNGLREWFSTHTEIVQKAEVLINNAGLASGLGTLQELRPEDWDVTIDTNIKGVLNLTHLVLPIFLKKSAGDIVNIGSVAGKWGYPKGNVYCATKAAVAMLNETLRLDLHGSGIRVTEIAPGMVETEFSLVRLKDPVKAQQIYLGTDPLYPKDIAEAVAWCVARPKRVNIQEMVIYPTSQASPGLVVRQPLETSPK